MDRFSAYLLVRRHLKQQDSRNRALGAEAAMEELAGLLGQHVEEWGVLGLLSHLDLEYARNNLNIQGKSARQQAELEGLPPRLARSLERWRSPDEIPRPGENTSEMRILVEDALFFSAMVVESVFDGKNRRLGDAVKLTSGLLEEMEGALGQDLDLRRQAGDEIGNRLDASLDGLQLDADQAVQLVMVGLHRVIQDLR